MRNNLNTNVLIFLMTGLSLGWVTPLMGQTTVTGQAFDQEQRPLNYATVVLKNSASPSQVVQSTLTDDNGHFTLKSIVKGQYNFSIIQLGYATYTQPLIITGLIQELNVGALVLPITAQALQEVTVTGKRPLLEQKPDRIIMHVGESVLSAGNDAYAILAMAPSVQLVDGRLTLNGKPNVLIVLDGKRLPGTTLESVLGSIPGSQIARIELITSPSAKYDAEASGGVIEIYTKRSQALGWNASLGANANQGVRPGAGINADLRVNANKLSLNVSGSYSKRAGFERGSEDRTLFVGQMPMAVLTKEENFNKVVRNVTFNGGLTYYPNNRTTTGADIRLIQSALDGSGLTLARVTQTAGLTRSRSLDNTSLHIDLGSYNAFYKLSLDTLGSSLMATGNYTRYTSQQQQSFRQSLQLPTDTIATQINFRNSAPATYNIYTYSLDYVKAWHPTTRLEAGVRHRATSNESYQTTESLVNDTWQPQTPNALARLGYQERISAGYASLNHSQEKLTLQVGLRAEYTHYQVVQGIDSSYFNLFPTVRADYKFTDSYSTSIIYARNINRPAYESLIPYELFLDTYSVRRGNAFLRPEYAHSFSWNHLYKGYGLLLAYTQTTNAIATVYLYDAARLRLIETEQNFQQRHLASATLTAPLTLATWWSLSTNLGLFYQRLTLPDAFEINTAYTKDKLYATVNLDNSFTLGRKWSAQLSGIYRSPSFNGILDFGTYSKVSAGFKRALPDHRGSLTLDISDIFHQASTRVSSSRVPVITDGIIRNDTRRVRLTLSYNLARSEAKDKGTRPSSDSGQLDRLGF